MISGYFHEALNDNFICLPAAFVGSPLKPLVLSTDPFVSVLAVGGARVPAPALDTPSSNVGAFPPDVAVLRLTIGRFVDRLVFGIAPL